MNSSKKLSGKAVRQKGLNFERDLAKSLRHIFPDVERQLEFQSSQAKGVDLRGTEPYLIQCKRSRKYASITKIEEVVPQKGKIPVLVSKGDNLKAVAVLYLEDFILMLEKIHLADKLSGLPEFKEEIVIDDLI